MSKAIVFVFGEEPTDADMPPPVRFDRIDGVAGEICRLRAALVGPPELPQEPPRDLSRVAVRTCPISGLESHR